MGVSCTPSQLTRKVKASAKAAWYARLILCDGAGGQCVLIAGPDSVVPEAASYHIVNHIMW